MRIYINYLLCNDIDVNKDHRKWNDFRKKIKFNALLFAQDIVRINMTSEKKEFAKNKVLAEAAEKAKSGNGRLHYLGLVS